MLRVNRRWIVLAGGVALLVALLIGLYPVNASAGLGMQVDCGSALRPRTTAKFISVGNDISGIIAATAQRFEEACESARAQPRFLGRVAGFAGIGLLIVAVSLRRRLQDGDVAGP
ncbi:hypothetical protein [Spirillospora sp. NPDC029432]|uniref:hypothetical protein n=1 Tax=Spirillospora sp. NPDC029432 TaxID=3154599 RepID=UPI003456F182